MIVILPRSTHECPHCCIALQNLQKQNGDYFGGQCPNCNTSVMWPIDWWQSQIELTRGIPKIKKRNHEFIQ